MRIRHRFSIVVSVAVLVVAGCHSTPRSGLITADHQLPNFQAESLAGHTIHVPSGLPKAEVLILFGFSPDAQKDMDRWIATAAEHGLDIIEVAILHDALAKPFARILASQMRQHTAPESYDKVWLVTGDADLLAAWIGETEPDHAYAYLLDAGHQIVQAWRSGFTASGFRDLPSGSPVSLPLPTPQSAEPTDTTRH